MKRLMEWVSKYGISAVLLGWLVYWGTTVLTPQLAAMRVEIAQLKLQMDPVSEQLQRMVNVQLQQCVNGATTDAKRDRCYDSLFRTPQRSDR